MFFNVNKILLGFSFLFLSSIGFSQNDITNDSQPITASTSDETVAAFVDQFKISNVGNLHLYARPENQTAADYYYQGTKMSPGFNRFFSDNTWNSMTAGTDMNAVLAVRYNDQDNLFIINHDEKDAGNTLSLYYLRGTKLMLIKKLAGVEKMANGTYQQMDSWIQDVDGDTLLDLIQKKRTMTSSGEVSGETTTVFLQQRAGNFVKSSETEVDASDYIFEDISK